MMTETISRQEVINAVLPKNKPVNGVLFKGRLEEGDYSLIKTIDGWVLKGKISYVGFNFVDRPQEEWINHFDDLFPAESTIECSICHEHQPIQIDVNFCPNCGAIMKSE